MGANNSTEANNLRREAAQLEKQRKEIEAEKIRLQQLQREHWEAERQRVHQETVKEQLRLQEEQRHREAAEKWRREKQQKEAYAELQRQVEELKIQQQLQSEQQKIFQQHQPNGSLPSTSFVSVTERETIPVQQKSLPVFQSNQIPNDTTQNAFSTIKTTQSTNSQANVSRNLVGPEQQKNSPVFQSDQIQHNKLLSPSTSTKSPQSGVLQIPDKKKIEPSKVQKILPQAEPLQKNVSKSSTSSSYEKISKQNSKSKTAASSSTKPTQSNNSQKNSPVFQSDQIQNNTSPSPSTLTKPPQSAVLRIPEKKKIEPPKLQTKLPQAEPLKKNVSETSTSCTIISDIHCEEWSIVNYVSEQNSISKATAENIIALLDDENTIPFIVIYRKNITQGMKLNELRKVKNSYNTAKSIKKRALSMIKNAKKKGTCTSEFQAFVNASKSLGDLNYISLLFNDSSTKNVSLKIFGEAIITGKYVAPLTSFVNPNIEGCVNEDQVKGSMIDIIAHIISQDKRVFDIIEKVKSKYPINVETKFANADFSEEAINQESSNENYAKYENFSSSESTLKRDEIFDINRGEARNVLKVNIIISQPFIDSFRDRFLQLYEEAVKASPLHKQLITEAINHMYNKWTEKFIIKSTRDEMTKRAENGRMEIIIKKIQESFFTLPVRGKNVIGIISISQWACKVAAVSDQGILLACETIIPHNTNNSSAIRDAETTLVNMVHKYNCTIFAVSNDKMMIKNVNFVESLIKKKAFGAVEITCAIVDDTGLSIYECSPRASLDFPSFDKDVIGAVSIARRLLNPIDELVKIEPKNLVPKWLLKDLPEKYFPIFDQVIMEAVSLIGVDLNTASADRLKRVAGLDEAKAKRILEWRQSSGPFFNRQDLLKVKGINNKTFEQCAGFIQIIPETIVDYDGQRSSQHRINQLDQTQIHPEYYDIATAFLKAAKCNINQLGSRSFIFAMKLFADQDHATLAERFDTTKDIIDLIAKALTQERTSIIKDEGDTKMFRKSLTSLNDLVIGTTLTGVVRNITNFGAFVDVGVETIGLIHKNYMGGMTISVGQRVETKVNNIEKERRRLGLTLIKCF